MVFLRWIRRLICGSPDDSPSVELTSEFYPHMVVAIGEVGVKEKEGANYHPRILEYLASVGIHDRSDEVPWCSAFVEWVLNQMAIEGTRSPLARSWLGFGNPIEPINAQLGDIVILERGSEPWMGHVGFFINYEEDQVFILGGNQGNAVTVRGYPSSKILGVREVPYD